MILGGHAAISDHDDPQHVPPMQRLGTICVNHGFYWIHLIMQAKRIAYYSSQSWMIKTGEAIQQVRANSLIYDNCKLDDGSNTQTDAGTINGCGEGWISRTWTIKDKCGNGSNSMTQKIYVKHRSDFEVIFPEDKTLTCDFLKIVPIQQHAGDRSSPMTNVSR